MARCERGYLCEVCGGEVEELTESDLYLRYVLGEVDPELLHQAAGAAHPVQSGAGSVHRGTRLDADHDRGGFRQDRARSAVRRPGRVPGYAGLSPSSGTRPARLADPRLSTARIELGRTIVRSIATLTTDGGRSSRGALMASGSSLPPESTKPPQCGTEIAGPPAQATPGPGARPEEHGAAVQPPGSSDRILFLDDDPDRARAFLGRHPEAVWVQTAGECIARLAESWDQVHLDHDLGGEIFVDSSRDDCGMEVVRWLCSQPQEPLPNTWFFVHSHNAEAADLDGPEPAPARLPGGLSTIRNRRARLVCAADARRARSAAAGANPACP